MSRVTPFISWSIVALSFSAGAYGASAEKSAGRATGREAVSAVRHDWKTSAKAMVQGRQQGVGPVPSHFGDRSVAARLGYLHARRNLDPQRFDHFHPRLGMRLALDDRLRAGQAQDCRPMSGLLPDTARTRYLQHRRSINPTRFDHYHPQLGAVLAEDQLLRSGQGCVSPELISPPLVGDTLIPPAPGVPSPVPPIGGETITPTITPTINPTVGVPEPGSITLILLGCTVIAIPKMRRYFQKPSTVEA